MRVPVHIYSLGEGGGEGVVALVSVLWVVNAD